MDHRLRMEIRLGHTAEGRLDFGSQQASCPPTGRSFSTASSSDPYTPKSGRSTPHQAPESMANFDPVICPSSSMEYELTPPASDLESYFPLEVKSEYPPVLSNCANMMRQPAENYKPGMNMAVHQMPDPLFHGMYSEPPSSQPLSQYSFPVQYMRHAPSDVVAGSYILPSSDFDAYQAWNAEPENFHGDFYPRPPSSLAPTEPLDVPMPNWSPRPSGSPAGGGRKRRTKQAQQKTKSLRRAQRRHSEQPEAEAYEDENWSDVECNFQTERKAEHFCQWTGCSKSFRRQEHLKRHHETVHFRYKEWNCEFCPPQKGPKIFNRFDNYRSHVILHMKRPSTSTKRTNYHPAAAAHLARLEAQMKVRTKKQRPACASPPASSAAAKKPSPTPSFSTVAYTPSSSSGISSGGGGGNDEAAPLTAACQGLRRLNLEPPPSV